MEKTAGKKMTLPEEIAYWEQMLLTLEDQANVALIRFENDRRIGRRARYFFRDCMAKVFLACWGVVQYCKRQEEPTEPMMEALQGLTQTMMELSIVTQLLPVMVDEILKGEDPIPARAEGWPRLRDFKREEQGREEQGAAAPPTAPPKQE